MMKIAELSIGDLVNQKMNDGAHQVQWIEREMVGLIKHTGTEEDGSIRLMAVPLSFIEPIPLTPKILEKNGWMRVGENNYRTVWYRNNIIITFRPSTGAFIIERHQEGHPQLILVRLVIRYLHQLQRALLMCGEEIKIVL